MATLKSLTNDKYDEHVLNLTNKRWRTAEVTENEIIKSMAQQIRWLMGAVSGDATEMSAALTKLEALYATTITAPTSQIGATVTELNTRRGKRIAVTAGDNTITFASPMDDADYSLVFVVYTANGGMIQWTHEDTADNTVNGFDIHVASAGFIDYIAIAN